MKKTILFLALAMSVSFGFCQEYGSFTDTRDGKVYKTVTINQVTWLAENLAFAPDSGNYFAYDYKDKNVKKFGYLYDWETAMKSCPAGWHLPDAIEWNLLIMNNGGSANAGVKLKASGAFIYDENVEYSYNESGFGIMPSGYYSSSNDEFKDKNWVTFLWSSEKATKQDINYAYYLNCAENEVEQVEAHKTNGLSVRCIKNY